jgi:hypothetical protein
MEAKIMTKKQQKNNQGTVEPFAMSDYIILSFLSHGVFLGKVKQNPIIQTATIRITDCLITVYNKIVATARGLQSNNEKLHEISSPMAEHWGSAGLFNILTNGGQRQNISSNA